MLATETTREWALQRGLAFEYTAETGSTNDDAKTRATDERAEFVLYLSSHQTAGRGRGDHHWLDTGAGEGLLSTWSFAAFAPPQAITGPRIGLALFGAASRAWPSLGWSLKAPNDLYLAGMKAGGLLIESVSLGERHRVLIGLGLNVTNHPRRFGNTATHLTAALGRFPDEGEWFRFLDDLKQSFARAMVESQRPVLSDNACTELKNALNANAARPFAVERVSPEGDLLFAGGVKRWTEL